MEFQCFQIKTEADSNDSTLCSDDVKPSTGMFPVSDSRGLVVTSGALPEPGSQLIHNRCITECPVMTRQVLVCLLFLCVLHLL